MRAQQLKDPSPESAIAPHIKIGMSSDEYLKALSKFGKAIPSGAGIIITSDSN